MADPASPRLRFEHVRLVLGGRTVLDDIDLGLAAPGLTVIAGPSGSGKSSLLRLCNRLLVPTAGCVRLDDEDLATIEPTGLRRRVGMVFQRATVFDGTCADNLRYARPEAATDALEVVLADVGLDADVLGRDARSLSGGEAQRLCLARTLLTEPEILLMDEPTSALDVDSRERIEHRARAIADGARAVLWVTHDLEQARRLADRSLVLAAGRVQPDAVAARCLEARTFQGLVPEVAGPEPGRVVADEDGDG